MDTERAGLKKAFGRVLDRESALREKRADIIIKKLLIKQEAENLFMVIKFRKYVIKTINKSFKITICALESYMVL